MGIKLTKEEKQKKAIAEGMGALQDAIMRLDRYAGSLDSIIDSAALDKRDEFSDFLIEQKVSVILLKRDFEFILLQLRNQVSAAQAFNSLKDLPKVLDECKKTARQTPDLSKLTDSMATYRDMTQKYAQDLKALREKLSQSRRKTSVLDSMGTSGEEDIQQKEMIEAEKQARKSRLAIKAANSLAPEETTKAVGNVDEIDSIMRGIEEEKRKK